MKRPVVHISFDFGAQADTNALNGVPKFQSVTGGYFTRLHPYFGCEPQYIVSTCAKWIARFFFLTLHPRSQPFQGHTNGLELLPFLPNASWPGRKPASEQHTTRGVDTTPGGEFASQRRNQFASHRYGGECCAVTSAC